MIESNHKDNNKVLVSVCIMAYNHEKYITQSLDSALMQHTNFPFEIILGEDESTDGTREICVEYANKYPDRIRLFLRSRKDVIYLNGNPTGRFNFIENLKSCRGKYIALLDGDDYWTDENKLQKQVDFLENNKEVSFTCSRFNILDDKEGIIRNHADDLFADGKDKLITIENLFNPFVVKISTIIFRTDFLKDIDFSIKYFKDIHLYVHLLEQGNGYCSNHVMATYRMSASGIWSQIDENKRKHIFYFIATSLIIKYRKKYDSLIRYYNNSFYSYASILNTLSKRKIVDLLYSEFSLFITFNCNHFVYLIKKIIRLIFGSVKLVRINHV